MRADGDPTAVTRSRRGQHLLMYATTIPPGIAGVWWLQRAGLIGDVSLVILVPLLIATGLLNATAFLVWQRHPTVKGCLHARLACSAFTTAAVIYTAGWGSMLMIAFALGSAELLRTAGAWSWRPGLVWNLAAIAAGELAVQYSVVPTNVPVRLAHIAAVVGAGCLVVVTRVLGHTSEAAEHAQARLRAQAARDPLTGLHNRSAFVDAAERACALSARNGTALAILYIDLDHYKVVNDSFGHASGDAVLVEAGRRLTACTRGGDLVARFGGDEFCLLLEVVDGRDHVIDVANRVLTAIAAPWDELVPDVALTASVGMAICRSGSDTVDELLRRSDHAMYEAKRGGRARWVMDDRFHRPSITMPA
jgi:diguanylate cyclase (GGDEF)-like protein